MSEVDFIASEGTDPSDPVRFHYIEVLARRHEAAEGLVRQVLADKLQQAVSDYTDAAERAKRAPHAAKGGVRSAGAPSIIKPSCSPLARLNQYIQARTQGEGADAMASSSLTATTGATLLGKLHGSSHDRPEMKSLRGFRESWAKIAAEQQVDKAVGRGPENAGPLNSHLLVLRSLGLMRDLSPDYLRRFLSHLDCLLWLDQAHQQYAVPDLKPARRSRKDK